MAVGEPLFPLTGEGKLEESFVRRDSGTMGHCKQEDASSEVVGDIKSGLWGLRNCCIGGSLPWGSGGEVGTPMVLSRPP